MEAAKDKNVNVICNDVVVILDREQGAKEKAQSKGMVLKSLIPFKSKGVLWLKELMAPTEYEILIDYLKDEQKYQDPKIQEQLRNIAITKFSS